MSIKSYVYIALTVLVGIALWRGGVEIYQAGANAERKVWEKAKAKAEAESRRKEQADTTTSEGVADATRAAATTVAAETREATTKTIETIRYVYRTEAAPACPDRAAPVGVQDAINAAYDAAAAAAR